MALVGNPLLICWDGLCIIGKQKSRSLFAFVVDFDYSSLYPTITELFNVYKKNLIGKVQLEDTIGENELRVSEDDITYDRGGKFIEDLTTQEYSFICNRWLNYPSIDEVLRYFDNNLQDNEKLKILKIHKIKKDKKIRTLKIFKTKKDDNDGNKEKIS